MVLEAADQVPVEVAWQEMLKAREVRKNLVTQMALKGPALQADSLLSEPPGKPIEDNSNQRKYNQKSTPFKIWIKK